MCDDLYTIGSSYSQHCDEAEPGPFLLPYMDENMNIRWLNAEEWAVIEKQQNSITSQETPQKSNEEMPQKSSNKETPQKPSNEETSQISNKETSQKQSIEEANPQEPTATETSPQPAVTVEVKRSRQKAKHKLKPASKKTHFFTIRSSGLITQLPKRCLVQPDEWRNIQMVIFGRQHSQHNVQYWNDFVRKRMWSDSKTMWQSDHQCVNRHKNKEPVTVTVCEHKNGGRWCQVASTVTSRQVFILEPGFMRLDYN